MPCHDVRRFLGVLLAAALTGILLLAPVTPARAQGDANWSESFGLPGTDSEVLCSTVWNGNLVVGGSFGSAGVVSAPCVALWDGTRWSALGAGFDGQVEALVEWNGTLYAAGAFGNSGSTSLNNLARWTGSAWVDVGGGVNGEVTSLLVTPSGLVVGGSFSDTPSLSGANNLALWNGTSWSALGGGLGAPVHGLAMHSGQVAAVGEFDGYVALFNGSFWSTVGGGLPDGSGTSAVTAVISHGGQLYVGGAFDPMVNGAQLLNVARWNGSQWLPLSQGVDDAVHGFGEWGGNLVLAGQFYNPIFHIGLWDGTNFQRLDQNSFVGWYGGDYVNTVAASSTKLYLGGVINQIWPSTYGANVFSWDGSAYASLGVGNGLDNVVQSISKWNGSIVVGGTFDRSYTTGGLNGTARWTGSQWAPLGSGLQSTGSLVLRVDGLTTFNTDLVACGQFTSAGGDTVNNIAHWNGTSWSPFGKGFESEIWQVGVYQGQLWAVGGYQELQGNTSGLLWKWSGSAWQSQANDVTGFALTVWNGKLILGGSFTTVAGVPANCVAQWDGTSWSALGSGLNAAVFTLAVFNNDLYASGEFYMSGATPVQGIARWSGTQWVPVGGAVSSNFAAHALGSGAGNLWMGGSWDHIGSTTGLSNIARWDGSAWYPLGSGTVGYVKSIFVDGTDVWAGGGLTHAGQKESLHIAKWSASVVGVPTNPSGRAALEMASPSPNPSRDATRITFSLAERAQVRLDIVDASGRLVTSVVRGPMDAGPHSVSWDGTSSAGSRVAAGVYWAVLSTGDQEVSKRLVRVR